jgi:hypothetical protein
MALSPSMVALGEDGSLYIDGYTLRSWSSRSGRLHSRPLVPFLAMVTLRPNGPLVAAGFARNQRYSHFFRLHSNDLVLSFVVVALISLGTLSTLGICFLWPVLSAVVAAL